jgi:regulator of RNase E activity RraB
MTEQKFPDDENGAALQHMAEQGLDLTAVHQVDFEYVFSDESSARKFAASLDKLGVEVGVRLPIEEDEDEWEVQCRKRMVPTHEEITALEGKLDRLADECGGESDGWGLMSNPDGSPVA